MNGCNKCPAFGSCTAEYRGQTCQVIRYSFGIEEDPEIPSNADTIRATTDEELAAALMKVFNAFDPASWYCKNKPECLEMADAEDAIPDACCLACLLDKLREQAPKKE